MLKPVYGVRRKIVLRDGYYLMPGGYWIYDGHVLTITEQEQVAKFIYKLYGSNMKRIINDRLIV